MQSHKGRVIPYFPFIPVPLMLWTTGAVFSCSFCLFPTWSSLQFISVASITALPYLCILSPETDSLPHTKPYCWFISDLFYVLLSQALSRSFELETGIIWCLPTTASCSVRKGLGRKHSYSCGEMRGKVENRAFHQRSWSFETFHWRKHLFYCLHKSCISSYLELTLLNGWLKTLRRSTLGIKMNLYETHLIRGFFFNFITVLPNDHIGVKHCWIRCWVYAECNMVYTCNNDLYYKNNCRVS